MGKYQSKGDKNTRVLNCAKAVAATALCHGFINPTYGVQDRPGAENVTSAVHGSVHHPEEYQYALYHRCARRRGGYGAIWQRVHACSPHVSHSTWNKSKAKQCTRASTHTRTICEQVYRRQCVGASYTISCGQTRFYTTARQCTYCRMASSPEESLGRAVRIKEIATMQATASRATPAAMAVLRLQLHPERPETKSEGRSYAPSS